MNYIQAIAHGFSNVQCSASNDGSLYTDLIWQSGAPLPTKAVLDAYIAANINVEIPTGTLVTGVPACTDAVGNVVSIATWRAQFASRSSSRNYYLGIDGISTSLSGYYITRNTMIVSAWVVIQAPISKDATFGIRLNGSSTDTYQFLLPAGQFRAKFLNIALPLTAEDDLAVYLSCANNVTNPIMVLELAWRN